jgi:hypothetical protein
MTGTISDPTGASVPNTTVTVTNIETGVARSSVTNASGNYLVTALLPGTYRVTTQAPGFKQMSREPIILEVDQLARIDFSLAVGGTQETVEVQASAVLLNSESSTISALVDNRQVSELPLNGRDPIELVALEPGIRVQGNFGGKQVAGGTAPGNWANFSFNGGMANANSIMVEGLALDLAQMNTPSFVPPVDATQEFRVQSNTFSAEYGRTSGAVVNFSIKSGTNQLHGSAFEFWRNKVLNANDFFQNRIGNPRPPFNLNQFGGAVGGPIRRDRTFFFANFEEYRRVVTNPTITSVPSPLQIAGDYSQTFNSAGKLVPIADPTTTTQLPGGSYTRMLFPGNIIPASRFSTVARNALKAYPAPNLAGVPFTGVNNLSTSSAVRLIDHQLVNKIDHNLNGVWKIFGTYSLEDLHQGATDPLHYTGADLTAAQGNFRNHITLSAIAVFSPGLVAELHTGYARLYQFSVPKAEGYDATQLGFARSFVSQWQIQSFPGFQPSGYATVGNTGYSRGAFNSWGQRASVTWVKGSHALKFGADYRIQQMNQFFFTTIVPRFTFSNQMTAQNPLAPDANNGNAIASFLLGDVFTANVVKSQPLANERRYLQVFLQDDWKVTRKFTVNIGTEYSFEFPITERYNRKMWFDQNAAVPVNVGFPVLGGFRFTDSNTRSPQDLYTHQFGPRVGFAYQLFPKTVIRSAYGIFWLPGAIMETTGDSRAPAFSINTPMVTSVDGNLTPFNTLDNPYPLPDGITNPPGASQGLLTLLGQDAAANRRYYHSGYTQQWNFDIQQDLGRNMLLEVTYSGSAGVGLPAGWATQINQIPDQYLSQGSALLQPVANPFYGLVATGNLAQKTIQRGQLLRPFPQFQSLFGEADPVGHSSFHSFATQFKKRFAHGLVGFSYTVSKAIGNTENRSDFLDAVTTNADGFMDIYNRGLNRSLMAYDVPQRLVVNYSLELPFGKGQKYLNRGGILNRLAGGWEINGIYTAQSGIPVALISQTNTVGNYSNVTDVYGTANSNTRPNNNGTSAILSAAPNTRLNQWFNTSVFSQPAAFTYGTAPRTLPDMRADGTNNVDFGAFKNNRFGHENRFNLQIRAEFFNMLNHVRFGNPGFQFGLATFGVVSAAGNSPRQVQLAGKLLF